MPTVSPAIADLTNGHLTLSGSIVLSDVPENVSLVEDPSGVGVFLHVAAESYHAKHCLSLGKPTSISRFTCCHRYEPFWVIPAAGSQASEIPIETQYLLIALADGQYALILPILDGNFRGALEGNADGELMLIGESGDDAVLCNELTAVFLAVGTNPYALMHAGARSAMARMKTGRLRSEKPLPDYLDNFGWCTWDAFYGEVSHEKVRQGLESFADGVQPRFLILDDGWQSTKVTASGEARLSAFAPNEKFFGDLTSTVQMAKQEFSVEHFIVWHAFQGYWGGIDQSALPQYRVVNMTRQFSSGILHHCPRANQMFGEQTGMVAPDSIHRFYNDYHRALALQGVDGLKVDSQSMLEGVSRSFGGRVAAMRAYHEALEGSVQTHFLGSLINCMSCSNEMIYSALNSNIIRTSTDFWPKKPESHGLHLYTNAQSSMWIGEFLHPDWDMFQSGHPAGAFHAAGRAVAGCAIYVSDKPESHNFDLLRKLVLSDGSVLRADGIGRPTLDCLFADVTRDDVLLKIFNHNGDAGVVGAFNCRYHENEADRVTLSSTVGPRDVEGLQGEEFAIYAHNAQSLTQCAHDEQVSVSLAELEFEIFSLVPIIDGFAAIGLADKYNSAKAVTSCERDALGRFVVSLRDGGSFVAWCAQQPQEVRLNGTESVAFTYDAAAHTLRVEIPAAGPCSLTVSA